MFLSFLPEQALKDHISEIDATHLRTLLQDSARNASLTAEFESFFLDFSRQRVTPKTMQLLLGECFWIFEVVCGFEALNLALSFDFSVFLGIHTQSSHLPLRTLVLGGFGNQLWPMLPSCLRRFRPWPRARRSTARRIAP